MKKSWLSSTWQLIFITAVLSVALILSAVPQINALGAGGVIALVNAQRGAAGLAPLSYNGALTSSAYAKAQDMLAKGYWAHTSPDGLTGWTFMSRAGYAYISGGENLARDFGTDSAVVAGWMGSAGHRANVLGGSYRDIGVAVASGTLNGAPTTIVVAHFGATAAAPAPAPAPAPRPAPQPAPAPVAAPRPAPAPAVRAAPVSQKTVGESERVAQESSTPSAEQQNVEAPVAIKEAPKVKNPRDVLIDSLVEMIEPSETDLISSQ